MGVFRKTASVLTVGLIDFRSDKERIARYARQTRNAVRAQSQGQMRHVYEQQLIANQRPSTAPGWYPSPDGLACLRWFDGAQWTSYTAPLTPMPPTGRSS